MEKHFEAGDRVRLKSFHNLTEPPKDTAEGENYWKLIGLKGKIISNEQKTHPAFPDMGKRALVQFADDIKNYGLICHNENAPNALWLFLCDLEMA